MIRGHKAIVSIITPPNKPGLGIGAICIIKQSHNRPATWQNIYIYSIIFLEYQRYK